MFQGTEGDCLPLERAQDVRERRFKVPASSSWPLGCFSFQTCQPVDRSVGRSVLVYALASIQAAREVVITLASMPVPRIFAPNCFAISVATIIFPIWLSCLHLYFSSQESCALEQGRRGWGRGGGGAGKWEDLGSKANTTFSIREYETVRN